MLISSPAEQVWRLAAQMGVIKRNSPQGAQQASIDRPECLHILGRTLL